MENIEKSRCTMFNLSNISFYREELMGIATIGIILCHAVGRGVQLPSMIAYLFGFGNFGVEIFLFLSGVSMYFSLHKKNQDDPWGGQKIISWYGKRFKRILIPYFIIAGPAWIIYCIVHDMNGWSFLYYLSTIGFWMEHNGDWFIAMLIPLYLITPVLGRVIDKSKSRFLSAAILILVIGGIVLMLEPTKNAAVWGNIIFVLKKIPIFIIGYWVAKPVQEEKQIPLEILVGLGMVNVCLVCIMDEFEITKIILISVSFILFFLIILRYWKWKYYHKTLRFMGRISLESYLTNIHFAYLLSLCSWRIGKWNISYGNYIYYGIVVVVGIYVANLVNKKFGGKRNAK